MEQADSELNSTLKNAEEEPSEADEFIGNELKTKLGHTNSLPGSQHLSPVEPAEPPPRPKHQSFRIKRPGKEEQQANNGTNAQVGPGQHPPAGSRWSFGGLAKSVGCGVTAFGSGVMQGTRAVGAGVVTGTKAVGTGVVTGTKAVGTGAMAVGTGVVEGTKVVASVSKDVTLAAGTKVAQAGDLALSGVTAVGEATVSAASATADAVKLAVKDSLDPDAEIHVVLPDEDLETLAEKYGISKRDLIRVNSLSRRSLRAGQEIVIPAAIGERSVSDDIVHPNEILLLKSTNEHDQEGQCRFTLDTLIWTVSDETKYSMDMDNVRLIRIDYDQCCSDPEPIPELLPPSQSPDDTVKADQKEVLIEDIKEDDEVSSSCSTKNKAQVVQIEDNTLSPEELGDSVRVKMDIFLYSNDGLNITEATDDDSSSNDDEDKVAKTTENEIEEPNKKSSSNEDQCNEKTSNVTKTFHFDKNELVHLATYLELWHAERMEMTPRIASRVSQEKDLIFANSEGNDGGLDDLFGTPVLTGDQKSGILEETHLKQLFANMPPKVQNQPWTLTYSTHINGFSLRNLYRCLSGSDNDFDNKVSKIDMENPLPSCLVIQSTEGRIFGAFLSCYPGLTESFVGTGKSWLFAFGGRLGQKLRIYKWSGLNEHFFRGTSDSLIIGADEGRFGILVDGDLHKGRVQQCSTFQNWPLADLEEDFVVGCLEVWTFESSQT